MIVAGNAEITIRTDEGEFTVKAHSVEVEIVWDPPDLNFNDLYHQEIERKQPYAIDFHAALRYDEDGVYGVERRYARD